MEIKPPLPPFTEETAKKKIKMAEDAWNQKTRKLSAKRILWIANGAIEVLL